MFSDRNSDIDYDTIEIDDIITKIEYAIEQQPSFLKVSSSNENN